MVWFCLGSITMSLFLIQARLKDIARSLAEREKTK